MYYKRRTTSIAVLYYECKHNLGALSKNTEEFGKSRLSKIVLYRLYSIKGFLFLSLPNVFATTARSLEG